ncbi:MULTISPECIES: tRNA pseudouridine(55) synthase TruB [Prochlorococcus]|uniref:tRNA pseudouridine(55) synthase TruB n=1 Tax=Prochlorococcus TaxID=1218 RepID=UPI00056150AA|nr:MULTISPECIES: tRNA pseudouridine(55) synthase TruB [Prochlorococcus]
MENPFGFVVIDKPAGITSHDCVSRLRKVYGIKKVGHGGTLDPRVTGVLPIAIGNATRLLPYLKTSKRYQGKIQFGQQSNTDDLDGEIISNQSWPQLSEQSINCFLDNFRGDIKQSPPLFSSIHINGERAYKKARRGEFFSIPKKDITIYELSLISWDQESGLLELNIHCSSGTYIRSLARDIGDLIGCGGLLAELRRIEALGFKESEAIALPSLEKHNVKKPILINPSEPLDHLGSYHLTAEEELFWRTGREIITSKNRLKTGNDINSTDKEFLNNHLLTIDHSGKIAGIGIITVDNIIRPKIVFNSY